MAFPRIYADQPCPLDGYEGYVFRVLVNPTGQEKTDWALGHLGTEACADCAALRAGADDLAKAWCPACHRAREQLGRAAVAIYGTSHVDGFDFQAPHSALTTFSQPTLPDDLLLWLYMLPNALWAARSDDLKKRLPPFSTTPN